MTELTTKFDAKDIARLVKRANRVLDERELLTGIGLKGLNWVDRNFRSEGLESPWKPLSPNTIASRRGGNAKILRDTGRLAQSFTYNVMGNKVSVGTNLKIAEYHNFGTGPFQIRPNTGKMLKFRTASGMVFARKVNHPGIPRRPLIPSKRTTLKIGVDFLNGALRAFNG